MPFSSYTLPLTPQPRTHAQSYYPHASKTVPRVLWARGLWGPRKLAASTSRSSTPLPFYTSCTTTQRRKLVACIANAIHEEAWLQSTLGDIAGWLLCVYVSVFLSLWVVVSSGWDRLNDLLLCCFPFFFFLLACSPSFSPSRRPHHVTGGWVGGWVGRPKKRRGGGWRTVGEGG